MAPSSLPALSPLDGRYAHLVTDLTEAFSEVALNHTRLHVETEWLITLARLGVGGVSALEARTVSALRGRVAGFDDNDVARLAELEATTQHDVKAVEYFLREILAELGLSHLQELTHFACTSEDINNLA